MLDVVVVFFRVDMKLLFDSLCCRRLNIRIRNMLIVVVGVGLKKLK